MHMDNLTFIFHNAVAMRHNKITNEMTFQAIGVIQHLQ
jgi:hypothetical protein